MDMETLMSLVGSLGFPIVACIFMWKYINSTLADFTKMMEENNRTTALLCDKIDLIISQVLGGGSDGSSKSDS